MKRYSQDLLENLTPADLKNALVVPFRLYGELKVIPWEYCPDDTVYFIDSKGRVYSFTLEKDSK